MEAHEGVGGGERYSSYSYLTSALDGCEWSALRPGRALPPVPIWQEAGWAPEPVWTQGLEEKSSAPVGLIIIIIILVYVFLTCKTQHHAMRENHETYPLLIEIKQTRKLHNEELRGIYSSFSRPTARIVNWRTLRQIGERGDACIILMAKSIGKRSLELPKQKWNGNIWVKAWTELNWFKIFNSWDLCSKIFNSLASYHQQEEC
jgi:hypothetical protein